MNDIKMKIQDVGSDIRRICVGYRFTSVSGGVYVVKNITVLTEYETVIIEYDYQDNEMKLISVEEELELFVWKIKH